MLNVGSTCTHVDGPEWSGLLSSQADSRHTMKRYWIDYQDTQPTHPMTYWVHREVDGKPWYDSEAFDPPRQAAIPGRGYPVFNVECDGFTFEFSSLAEMRVCIETLAQKLLPRTIDLARERGTAKGPNSHWLSRLPGRVKSWRYREKAVAYLCEALNAFAQDIA